MYQYPHHRAVYYVLLVLIWGMVGFLGGTAGFAAFGWAGFVGGFLAGLLLPVVAILAIAAVEHVLWQAGPSLPPCHKGRCTGAPVWRVWADDDGDYERAFDLDDGSVYAYRCRCGLEYGLTVEADRCCFMERRPDGTLRPYMVHRRFRGWRPDPGPV
jgi:hypothetical protein